MKTIFVTDSLLQAEYRTIARSKLLRRRKSSPCTYWTEMRAPSSTLCSRTRTSNTVHRKC